MIDVPTFFEAEKFIREIEFDVFHPINNPSHKSHEVCKKAFNQLKSKVSKARAELEAARYFDINI
jgi:predicted aspartyl protease